MPPREWKPTSSPRREENGGGSGPKANRRSGRNRPGAGGENCGKRLRFLGIREVSILGFPDGAVDQVDASVAIRAIAAHIRRIRPHVVITFGQDGAYGHPDHIAICQFATASTVCAADRAFHSGENPDEPHRVSKLYYMAWRKRTFDLYQTTFRKLTSTVDGVQREATPWPDWAVTTEIETSAYWPVVWRAIRCHQTQIAIYEQLDQFT